MPRLKRRTPHYRKEWHVGHQLQLLTGWDFLGNAWGDRCKLPMDDRQEWPASEVLEEMREAWHDLRDEILAAHAREHRDCPIFGLLVFDEGQSPHEAFESMRRMDADRRERREQELRVARGVTEPGR